MLESLYGIKKKAKVIAPIVNANGLTSAQYLERERSSKVNKKYWERVGASIGDAGLNVQKGWCVYCSGLLHTGGGV